MMLYISVSINFRRNKLGLIIYKIYWNENLPPGIQSITLLKTSDIPLAAHFKP